MKCKKCNRESDRINLSGYNQYCKECERKIKEEESQEKKKKREEEEKRMKYFNRDKWI